MPGDGKLITVSSGLPERHDGFLAGAPAQLLERGNLGARIEAEMAIKAKMYASIKRSSDLIQRMDDLSTTCTSRYALSALTTTSEAPLIAYTECRSTPIF